MMVNQFEIWIADLEPRQGTEAGKVRPVLIIQTDLLNKIHPSTIICPITTNVEPESEILRVHINKGNTKIKQDCDIMIDQIRSIDNRRLVHKVGELPKILINTVKENIKIVLGLDY